MGNGDRLLRVVRTIRETGASAHDSDGRTSPTTDTGETSEARKLRAAVVDFRVVLEALSNAIRSADAQGLIDRKVAETAVSLVERGGRLGALLERLASAPAGHAGTDTARVSP